MVCGPVFLRRKWRLLEQITREVAGHLDTENGPIVNQKKGRKAQPHFRTTAPLYEKAAEHNLKHAHTDIFTHECKHTRTHRRRLISPTDTHARSRTLEHKIHKRAQTQCTNTKRTSWQSRWAPFRVELKAVSKPVLLGRGGVRQPAEAPARCPRVARVTRGLLPCHCLDQRDPLLSSRRWQHWS